MVGASTPATPLTRGQHLIRSQICNKLKTKADALGIPITEAPQFYASSKICSCCGHKKKDLTLSERTYHCNVCQYQEDRDVNAAINLENLAVG